MVLCPSDGTADIWLSWCCGNCINCRHLLLSTPGRSLSALFSLPFRIFFMAIDQFNNSFLGQRSADVHQLLPSRGVMEVEVGNWESGAVEKPCLNRCAITGFSFCPLYFSPALFSTRFVLAFVSDERFFFHMAALQCVLVIYSCWVPCANYCQRFVANLRY